MKIYIASITAGFTLLLVDAGRASAQTAAPSSNVQARTQVIAASFNKFKNVSKEKRGVRKDKYLKVVSEPAVKSNPEDYSGSYGIPDFGVALRLRVDRSGKVEGDGYDALNDDPAVRRTFTLRNGKVEGALLNATKVYADGQAEKIEGLFINRKIFESPTDKGTVRFGLGVLLGKPYEVSSITVDKLFYEPQSQ
jgi:hypothetical protein